ncbi:MAG: Uma2 family endonuclease [Symploca sp. SIO2E6]|nr:Uma2 family endonuclease [Symploca sp. SIO2E6]
MTITTNRRMTFLEYLNYDDGTDTRYELVNGVLVEMGAESTINTQIAVFLLLCFAQLNIPAYRLGIKQKIAVKGTGINAREPDLMIHSEASARAIDHAPQAVVKLGYPTPMLIVEVVSPGKPGEDNYDRDYIEKRREYAARGIQEYWLIDPHRKVVLVLTLQGQSYQEQRFSGANALASPTFPNLNLTAEQILNAGKE